MQIFRFGIISVCLFLGSCSEVQQLFGEKTEVWPREAEDLAPVALGDFVAEAIPTGTSIEWDYLDSKNVLWLTEGIHQIEGGSAIRTGVARIIAGAEPAKILRQKWEELAWEVTLSTPENIKWGAKSLTIRPGFEREDGTANYQCFGTAFTGCDFPATAIESDDLKLEEICRAGNADNMEVVYRATAFSKNRAMVVYEKSSGSSGSSSWVTISLNNPKDRCKEIVENTRF